MFDSRGLFARTTAFVAVLLMFPPAALLVAQTPVGEGPPTYDWDPMTPGTQDASIVLGGAFTAREFWTNSLRVSFRVPLADVQSALPRGFTAVPNPAGSDTARISLNFYFQVRLERAGMGTFGPYSMFDIDTPVVDPAGQSEAYFRLISLVSDEQTAAARNSLFGRASTDTSKIQIEIDEDGRMLQIEAFVQRLGIFVIAQGPSSFAFRAKSAAVAFGRHRNADNPVVSNPRSRLAFQSDTSAPAVVSIAGLGQGDRIQIPRGELRVQSDVLPGALLQRSFEMIYRPDGEPTGTASAAGRR